MARLSGLGLGARGPAKPAGVTGTEFIQVQRPLRRILAFTRRGIDDVVNDPIVKREVFGYYKLHRQIERAAETRELEQQWNSVA